MASDGHCLLVLALACGLMSSRARIRHMKRSRPITEPHRAVGREGGRIRTSLCFSAL
jgi:hypothetical protein